MSELIDEGKITHWGITEADEEHIRRAHVVCHVTATEKKKPEYLVHMTFFDNISIWVLP